MIAALRVVGAMLVVVGIAVAVALSSRTTTMSEAGVDRSVTDAVVDGFVARTARVEGAVMPYRLFLPQPYDAHQTYPLVIWLHGAGGIGEDNRAQIAEDQTRGTHTWTDPRVQGAHPSFVFVPQSDTAWDPNGPDNVELPSVRRVAQIIEQLGREFRIDAARTYLLGQSLGGRAALNLGMSRPDLFAAIVVLCPAPLDLTRADRMRKTPLWIFQGSGDSAAFVAGSRDLISRLRAGGGAPRYTEYEGLGHEIWDRTFADPDLVEWVFRQHR